MELARGIEPPTCGLQIISSPTSDNLTPQETTKDDPSDRGQDGPSLSCPGSSVVAESLASSETIAPEESDRMTVSRQTQDSDGS